MDKNLIAVIFVKQSERFPGKHMAMLGNRTLLDTVAGRVVRSGLFDEVIIFSKDGTVRSGVCTVVQDATEGSIAISLLHVLNKYGDVFVFAGDMPCISADIIRQEIDLFDGRAVVPKRSDGTLETLHSIYPASGTGCLESNLKAHRYALRDLVKVTPHVFYQVQPSEEVHFLNVNSPSDLEIARENGCDQYPFKTRKW